MTYVNISSALERVPCTGALPLAGPSARTAPKPPFRAQSRAGPSAPRCSACTRQVALARAWSRRCRRAVPVLPRRPRPSPPAPPGGGQAPPELRSPAPAAPRRPADVARHPRPARGRVKIKIRREPQHGERVLGAEGLRSSVPLVTVATEGTPRKWERACAEEPGPRPCTGAAGAALGMGEPEPEAEQIRLKCIRKEGFFTVPPEHRVRSEGPRRQGGAERAGASVSCESAEVSGTGGNDSPRVPRGRRGGRRRPSGRGGAGPALQPPSCAWGAGCRLPAGT